MNSVQLVKDRIRSIKDFPIEGIIFRDITTAIKDKEALREMINFLTEKFINKGIDYVAVIESRGFIFGSALAYNINAGCILIRKPGKLPAETISEEYSLEYGTDKLEIHKDAIEEGKNVIVIDDLLATGGTVSAACKLLKKAGANVKAAAFVIELADLNGRKNLPQDIEVVSMVTY
ncbi:TPA: adenine phosphoribosyltransferase [Candidatus Avigastranaerophilus faecigallinarum]|nr:adenine phosphoribosyltransferase [Candidatus Avigastranaerophilus faecigallinarum]